ncbi:MAG: extracellular solute-binding protein [Acidobacteria bacterium]|nr:extracellular solute-binding protein [Acidobacteriota bacterium]
MEEPLYRSVRIWTLTAVALVALGCGGTRTGRTGAEQHEGTLTLYTTIAEKDLPTLLRPFEAKYGIRVNVWRAGTDNVLQRTVSEHAAKRYDVDVIHAGAPEMEALARERILAPTDSPLHADLQPGSVPPHRQWAATLLSVWVQAYNTKLLKRDDLPRSYADLLDPKWKGKIGIEAKDQDWFASVVDVMGGGDTGLRFFRTLVATNGVFVRLGHTLLTNMVISGEVPLALTIYNYMPEQAKKKGAPIDWIALEPAIARSNGVGVARQAPHPKAARLFYDYLLSEEAQQYFVGMDYVPSNTKVISPLRGIRILQTDPARTLDESPKWVGLFEATFIKRGGSQD